MYVTICHPNSGHITRTCSCELRVRGPPIFFWRGRASVTAAAVLGPYNKKKIYKATKGET